MKLELFSNTRASSQDWIVETIKYLSGFTLVALMVILVRETPYHIFPFRFNFYALFSIAASLANIVMIFLIRRPRLRAPETLWFFRFLGALLIWTLTETFQRLSGSPEAGVFWSMFSSLGWVVVPGTFCMFALVYTNQESPRQDISIWFFLFYVTLLFLFMTTSTSLINHFDPALAVWTPSGWNTTPGPYFWLFFAWFALVFVLSLALFVRSTLLTDNPQRSRQLRIFGLAVVLLILGGSISDGILPMLGYYPVGFASFFGTVMAALMTFGIYRYGLLRFSSLSLAGTILDTMNEAVIGVGTDNVIRFLNQSAEQLIGRNEADLIGQNISSLFDTAQRIIFKDKALSRLDRWNNAKIDRLEVTGADDNSLPVSLKANTVLNEQGELLGYIFILNRLY